MLRREVEAIQIPSGYPITLAGGSDVVITQSLGGTYTVTTDHGVLVRDFSRWPRLEGCLRVTIGTPDENDAFLTALRGVTA